MNEFAIFCGIVCVCFIQFLFVAVAGANEKQLFNHDLGHDYPTPYAVFLIIVPGSFIIAPIVKFAIDFVTKVKETIEDKYDRLTKEAYDA